MKSQPLVQFAAVYHRNSVGSLGRTSSETRITIIGHLQNEYEEKMKRKRSNSSRKERGHVSL